MKIDKIRELVHRAPFQPFTIHAAGGPPAHVPHPDFIALSPTGRTVLVYATVDGSHTVIEVPLISQIEVHDRGAGVS